MSLNEIESILRCPISGRGLHFAGAAAIVKLHADIAAKRRTHLDGSAIAPVFGTFLATDDYRICYPVRDNILILLPDFALVDEDVRRTCASHLTSSTTKAIMRFYDEIGWQKTGRGVFYDADINEDMRDVSRRYIHDCHLRVNDHLPKGGRYLLDIASGPVQYDEYLTYSDKFSKHICCDVSFEALRAAAGRLGDKGLYIQADITNIPLKERAVDAFVSLHTIYHVPAERQIECFRELERVTKNGGGGVVVYSWDTNSWGSKIGAPCRALAAAPARWRSALHPFIPEALLKWRRNRRAAAAVDQAAPVLAIQAASQYCFHAHDYRWFKDYLAATGRWHLHSWRSIGPKFLNHVVPNNALGQGFLALIYRLESLAPALFGRIGQYPMFVFRKPGSGAQT